MLKERVERLKELKEELNRNKDKEILNEIMNTRKSLDEIAIKTKKSVRYIRDLYSEEKDEYLETLGFNGSAVRTKIQENARFNQGYKGAADVGLSLFNQNIPIKEEKMINILDENIKELSETDYNKIKVVVEYIDSGCNLEECSKKLNKDQGVVYSIITDQSIIPLLKKEAQEQYKKYIDIELALNGDIKPRKDKINNVLETLKKNNWDINVTCIEIGIPFHLLERVLTNNLMFLVCDANTITKLNYIFKSYKENNSIGEDNANKKTL